MHNPRLYPCCSSHSKLLGRISFLQASAGSSISGGFLWMVTGASKLRDSEFWPFLFITSKSYLWFQKAAVPADCLEQKAVILVEQNCLRSCREVFQLMKRCCWAATDAVKTAICNSLIKKQYSVEKRELRKRRRNDKENQAVNRIFCSFFLITEFCELMTLKYL